MYTCQVGNVDPYYRLCISPDLNSIASGMGRWQSDQLTSYCALAQQFW